MSDASASPRRRSTGTRSGDLSKVSTESVERASPMAGLPPITVIARDLGAPGLKDGRCAAWYRGGKNPRSLKLDDAKGCWYDFGQQQGDGIIRLVEVALGVDRREAVEWLRRQYQLGKPDSGMRQRREQARSEGENLLAFVNRMRERVFEIRNSILTDWHLAQWAARGPDRAGDLPASEWRRLRRRLKLADGIDEYMRHVEQLPAAELIALRNRLIEVQV